MKSTIVAPANIAFVKYWGARDLSSALPLDPSISMTLSVCATTTTVEALPEGAADSIELIDAGGTARVAPERFAARVLAHLERLRAHIGTSRGFRVATRNSFPAAAGLASSASGFAALATAVSSALGDKPSGRELSIRARLSGSGSASRSVLGGYVEWPAPPGDDPDAPAAALFPASHWDLADVIAVVETAEKDVASIDGHRRAATSPHFETRRNLLPTRLAAVRLAIEERRLDLLGPVLEEEAVELHLIAMSSRPPIFYWRPATLAVLEAIRRARQQGLSAWATMDAGANVHTICERSAAKDVAQLLRAVAGVEEVIEDHVGNGPVSAPAHLF